MGARRWEAAVVAVAVLTVAALVGFDQAREREPVSSPAPPQYASADVAQADDEDCGHDRVERAMDDAPLDTPDGWDVSVRCDEGSELAGEALPVQRLIRIWPEAVADGRMTHTLVHEYAHALDEDHMRQPDGDLWMYARGLEGRWHGGKDMDRPNEDFAEAFATCVTGDESWLFEGDIPQDPPTRQECALAFALVGDAEGAPGASLLTEVWGE